MKMAAVFATGLLALPLPALSYEIAADMSKAAAALLATLAPEQRAKTQFAAGDAERKNWHFIPRTRQGLPLKEMSEPQRRLVMALLRTALSEQGYEKTATIISLEAVLRVLEAGRPSALNRDPELYFISVFGTPQNLDPWGWRLEGHHLSLNFTVVGGQGLAVTPSFFGANPAEVRSGPRKGVRPLRMEEDLGRALAVSLTPEQRRRALAPEAPRDVLNGPARTDLTEPEGIEAGALTAEQKRSLTQLIGEYLGRHRPERAAEDWGRIEQAGLEKVHFLWAGSLARGEPHYYRVQGPTFVLEYGNTQNRANHAHSVWRDNAGDFGEDLLRRHYEAAHHK